MRGGEQEESLVAARLRKLKAEADKAEHEAARMKREAVSIDLVRDNVARATHAMLAGLRRLEGDLPPLLAGLTESQILPVLRQKFHDVQVCWNDAESDLWREVGVEPPERCKRHS